MMTEHPAGHLVMGIVDGESAAQGALKSAFECFLEAAKFERMARDTKGDNEREKLIATARYLAFTVRHRPTLGEEANAANRPTNA